MDTDITLGTYIAAFLGAIIIGLFSGCSFKIEAGYHGKSERSDVIETAEFRNVRAKRY